MLTFILSYLLIYTYVVLFAVVFLAAVALPLPTGTLMLATGAFAGQGFLDLRIAFAVAMVANVSGDLLGFFFARRFGERVLDLLRRHPSVYEHALDRFLERSPGLAIFLSRFAGTADPVLNVLSGWAGVSVVRFLWYGVLGNIIAIGSVMYFGYLVGENWTAFVDIIRTSGYIVGVIVLLIGIVAVFGEKLGVYRLWRRLVRRIERALFDA